MRLPSAILTFFLLAAVENAPLLCTHQGKLQDKACDVVYPAIAISGGSLKLDLNILVKKIGESVDSVRDKVHQIASLIFSDGEKDSEDRIEDKTEVPNNNDEKGSYGADKKEDHNKMQGENKTFALEERFAYE